MARRTLAACGTNDSLTRLQRPATLYEFARHEGNDSMTGILGGARAIGRRQAAAAPAK
jgi:hypothetical protein